MKPIIDHIQITVSDMETAEPFYDRLAELLGFYPARTIRGRVDKHDFDVIEYVSDELAFGINSPRPALSSETVHRRRPGSLHHIAFRADSCEEVDRLHQELLKMPADIVGGPKFWPEHGAAYYAVFFKDPCGIKLEIVHDGER